MSDKGFFIIVLTLILTFFLLLMLIFREAITEYVKTQMYERQHRVREPLLERLIKNKAEKVVTDYVINRRPNDDEGKNA